MLAGSESTSLFSRWEEAARGTSPFRSGSVEFDLSTFLQAKGYRAKPLADWKTDLRYLKFGLDRPEGGSSPEPYATFPTPGPYPKKIGRIPGTLNVNTLLVPLDRVFEENFLSGYTSNFNLPTAIINLYNANKSLDYPIRGGGTFDTGFQTTTLAGQVDKRRIQQFLKNNPKGEAFVRKQKSLQFSNPLIETGEGLEVPEGAFSFNNLIWNGQPAYKRNTRVYNPANTIAQVAGSGTGLHAVRSGFSPFDASDNYYAKTVGKQMLLDPNTSVSTNRLLILQQLKLTNNAPIVNLMRVSGLGSDIASQFQGLNTALASTRTAADLGLSMNSFLIQSYLGGPNSAYGIGFTTTRRVVDTSPKIDNTQSNNSTFERLTNKLAEGVNRVRTGIAMTYEAISKQNINATNSPNTEIRSRKIQDFILANSGIDLNSAKIQDRETLYYGPKQLFGLEDRISAKSAIPYAAGENPWQQTDDRERLSDPDLINFGFECLNNNIGEQNTFIQFRAYLSNGFTDNHTANWTSFKYAGRGESFYTYQGFERAISFGFRLLVENSAYLKEAYRKLNYLVSQTYPDYSPYTGIMRGSVVRLTMGDYFYRLPGVIESVQITARNDASWDINEYGYSAQLPQFLEVSVTFKPIMDELPQKSDIINPNAMIIAGGIENDMPYGQDELGDASAEIEEEIFVDISEDSGPGFPGVEDLEDRFDPKRARQEKRFYNKQQRDFARNIREGKRAANRDQRVANRLSRRGERFDRKNSKAYEQENAALRNEGLDPFIMDPKGGGMGL